LVHLAPVNENKETEVVVSDNHPSVTLSKRKGLILAIVVLAGLALFWYKTNTWPIVAMVNSRPITRFEVNKMLFRQGGTLAIDEIVTQLGVESKLKRLGIVVTDSEVDEQIAGIRESLGTEVTLESRLAERGLTMDELISQIKIQVGMEKVVKDSVQVTPEEITAYVKQLGSVLPGDSDASKAAEAEKALRSQKMQDEISKWIEQTRTEMKVWYINDSMKLTQDLQY